MCREIHIVQNLRVQNKIQPVNRKNNVYVYLT